VQIEKMFSSSELFVAIGGEQRRELFSAIFDLAHHHASARQFSCQTGRGVPLCAAGMMVGAGSQQELYNFIGAARRDRMM
jgi:hypothetical protein